MRQQLEGLEHEAELGLAKAARPSSSSAKMSVPSSSTVPLARRVEAGQQAEQGRLAGTGGADEGERLGRLHGKIDAVQDGEFAAGVRHPLGQAGHFDGAGGPSID
jgi:hypothetical protein